MKVTKIFDLTDDAAEKDRESIQLDMDVDETDTASNIDDEETGEEI